MEEKIEESTGYQRARQRHLMLLKEGVDLGTKGSIAISRDEIHAIHDHTGCYKV